MFSLSNLDFNNFKIFKNCYVCKSSLTCDFVAGEKQKTDLLKLSSNL